MNKKLISILLSVVLIVSFIPVGMVTARAESALVTGDAGIAMLKNMEGFSSKPYWDYSQWTVGYGTRCPDEDLERYRAEGITEAEAEALLRTYLSGTEKAINGFADKYGLTLSQNQFDALVLFSYNCGTAWLYQEHYAITSAVINGAVGNDFLYPIGLWCSAGGEILPGLIERRLIEANIYLNGVYEGVSPANYAYVRYDANGGSVEYRVQAYDSDLTAEILMTPVCAGYTFEGWYTQRTGGTKVTVLDKSVQNGTIYAHWSNAETGEETVPTEKAPEGTAITPVTVQVTGDEVNIRRGPGTDYDIVDTAYYGRTMTITATASGSGYKWGKFDGGWIALNYTNFDDVQNNGGQTEAGKPADKPQNSVQESAVGYVTSDDGLRIRTGAGTFNSVKGYLSYGEKVVILERTVVDGMTWGRIADGWICMDYVRLENETKPAPEQKPTEKPQEKPEEAEKPAVTEKGTVNTEDLRIRTGPSTAYDVVGYLSTGDRVEILEKKTNGSMVWGKISNGWISLDYVDLDSDKVEPEKPEQGTPTSITGTIVFTDELRIRSGAGTEHEILGYLNRGTRVHITEQKEHDGMMWGKIDRGWISMDYVEVDSDHAAESKMGTVHVGDMLCIRNGAGTSYAINGYLYNGDRVEITEVKSAEGMQWGRISRGWISLDYVNMDGAAPEKPQEKPESGSSKQTVIADCLHIRSGAGLSYTIVGYLYEGAKVEITETKTADGMTWGRVSDGWISMNYVK